MRFFFFLALGFAILAQPAADSLEPSAAVGYTRGATFADTVAQNRRNLIRLQAADSGLTAPELERLHKEVWAGLSKDFPTETGWLRRDKAQDTAWFGGDLAVFHTDQYRTTGTAESTGDLIPAEIITFCGVSCLNSRQSNTGSRGSGCNSIAFYKVTPC